MNSSQFNIRIIIHATLIAVTSGLFLWAITEPNKIVTSISLFFLWLVEIYLLIRYVNKTNRNLLIFLQSFKFGDSSLVFNKYRKLPFRPIYEEFNRIIEQFRNLKIEKEIEHQYFEHIIKHVDTGIVAWDDNEKIQLYNSAAKNILEIPHLISLDGLKQVAEDIPERFRSVKAGTREIIRIWQKGEIKNIYVRATEFNLNEKNIKLVSLQDIRPELEDKEAEAWQRLIKVLTHEIINSVGPIKLVSSSLMKSYRSEKGLRSPHDLKNHDIENTYTGLKAIHTRSLGLSKFVEDYKTITEIPKPVFKSFSIRDMVNDVLVLFKQSYLSSDISVNVRIEPDNLEVTADRKMIEQIFINILKNAVQALEDHPTPNISVYAYQKGENVFIEISDNGSGIPFNVLDFIFMPFFTTKTEGSGIGLTLSRQIMKRHNGHIRVQSKEGEGTQVILQF